jgi:hypothetical protein
MLALGADLEVTGLATQLEVLQQQRGSATPPPRMASFGGDGWEGLSQELGSGMTCWRLLKRRTDDGVFDQLHQLLLARSNYR